MGVVNMFEKYGKGFLLMSLSKEELAQAIASDLDNDYDTYHLHAVYNDKAQNKLSYHFEGYKKSTQKYYDLSVEIKATDRYPFEVKVHEHYDNRKIQPEQRARFIEIELVEESLK